MIENKQGSVWITVARHRACLGSLHRKTATPGRPRTGQPSPNHIPLPPLSPPADRSVVCMLRRRVIPISKGEFYHLLQQCIPPGGWPDKIGTIPTIIGYLTLQALTIRLRSRS